MTSLERVLAALGHREPDRVPFFLLLTMHGAKELGLGIREYFARAANVVEGQLRLRAKYRHDCIYTFFYAPLEIEAWGGEVIYCEDGPPNSGAPFLRQSDDILRLTPPRIEDCPCLTKVLDATAQLKARVGAEAPIIGVVMSPFSLPVMQLGFERYLEILLEQPALFERLMSVNEEFCVAWANAQLAAGATAICYFDPVSSPTLIPKDLLLRTGLPVAGRTLARFHGPVAVHYASGACLSILEDIAALGVAAVGVSAREDLAALKAVAARKVSLLGNLNGIEMRRWDAATAEAAVKRAIAQAAAGGGFILSDNHGEIPWQVPDDVLLAVSDAVHRWGQYPLDWVKDYEP
jgi:uroporphyrinogen decarboxylase